MAFLTFRGGIHPYDGKDLSKNCPVEKYLPKGDLAILVSQHIGAPAKPIVKKGDHVLAGQKIAEAGGFVSAPIHSSVSGTVKGIEKRLTAVGAMGDAIIIENDGLYESVEYAPAKLSDLSKEDILKRIQEGGVVGQGGAGFPTHVKLSPKEPDKIDHILVNGAECEPYITSDYRRMMEEPESIVGGLEVILKAFPKAVGCICIEDNKPDCIARMKEAIKGKERMEVKELKTKYPQGGERTLCSVTILSFMDCCSRSYLSLITFIKFSIIVFPSGVITDSGWNCNPNIGYSLCSSAITSPSSDSAVTTSFSGKVSLIAASE